MESQSPWQCGSEECQEDSAISPRHLGSNERGVAGREKDSECSSCNIITPRLTWRLEALVGRLMRVTLWESYEEGEQERERGREGERERERRVFGTPRWVLLVLVPAPLLLPVLESVVIRCLKKDK